MGGFRLKAVNLETHNAVSFLRSAVGQQLGKLGHGKTRVRIMKGGTFFLGEIQMVEF